MEAPETLKPSLQRWKANVRTEMAPRSRGSKPEGVAGGPGAARPLPDMPGGRRHQARRRRKWKMRLKGGVIQKKVKKEACPWGPWELAQPHSDPVAGGRSSGPGSPTRRHRGAVN